MRIEIEEGNLERETGRDVQKTPMELAIIWVRVMSGTEKAPAVGRPDRNLAKSERKEARGDTYQQEREGKSHVGARGRRESSPAMGGKNATKTTARGRKSARARARKSETGASPPSR